MTPSDDERILVVGGGLGGLAAACVLAGRGHKVTLIEKNAWLGGKAAVLRAEGFRFDMGPTILTLPRVLERIFAEAGQPLPSVLPLKRLDPQWRCFFSDGTQLDLVEDTEAMAASLEAFAPGSGLAKGYGGFMDLSAHLAEISESYFFWKPVGALRDAVNLREAFDLSVWRDILALRMGWTVSGTVGHFLTERRARQMAEHFTQYVGSSPLAAPAVLCGIAHMQVDEGIWYPQGGIRAVAEALGRLAERLNVRLRTGEEVTAVLQSDGRAAGVELASGERLLAKSVVSNSDSVRTYTELVGGRPGRRFARRYRCEPACSGVVLLLGLKERYDHLLHHNFVFSRDAEAEFGAIYGRGEPAPDPSCYVCAPSASDPTVAPRGGEALYVLTHTPYLRSRHDWDAIFPGYRRTILDKLKRDGGMADLAERIVFASALTPADIHARYRVLQGAIYGLASHGRFTGAFKPGNRSPYLKGLYLAGGSAHPGPGVPMALMSGWIAADALHRDQAAEVS
jgi:phytoene desaturase